MLPVAVWVLGLAAMGVRVCMWVIEWMKRTGWLVLCSVLSGFGVTLSISFSACDCWAKCQAA